MEVTLIFVIPIRFVPIAMIIREPAHVISEIADPVSTGAIIGGFLTGNLNVSYQLTFIIYAIPAIILFITVLFTTDWTKEFNS